MPKPLFSPLCLRVALGVTFLWAGLGKLVTTFDVQGEQAATLANAGVDMPAPAAAPQPAPLAPPVTPPTEPPPRDDRDPSTDPVDPEADPERLPPSDGTPLHSTSEDPLPLDPMHPKSPSAPVQSAPDGSHYVLHAALMTTLAVQDGSEPRLKPIDTPPIEPRPRRAEPGNNSNTYPDTPADPDAVLPSRPDDAAPSRPVYTPADFPNPVPVRGLYRLVLLMHDANQPSGTRADGSPLPPIWPDVASSGNRLVLLAWGAALCELVFAILCLAGFLTRLGALSFAGVMLVAIWLTEIGPAIQSGTTVLGFLPDRPPFDPGAWSVLLWQFAILMSALALLFLGPGRLSIDHLLFGGFTSRNDDDDD